MVDVHIVEPAWSAVASDDGEPIRVAEQPPRRLLQNQLFLAPAPPAPEAPQKGAVGLAK